MCSRISSLIKVQTAKPILYKQYKSTDLDDMSYVKLQTLTSIHFNHAGKAAGILNYAGDAGHAGDLVSTAAGAG